MRLRESGIASIVAIGLWLLATGACRRGGQPTGGDVLVEAAPSVEASAVAPAPPDALTDKAERGVRVWSDALDRHDVVALEGLYGDPVRFYGREVPRAAVLQAKRAALKPATTFHQEIVGPVAVAAADDGTVVASFVKRSGASGKLRDVGAKLVLRATDGGEPVIVEETDETTEHRGISKDLRAECEATAERVTAGLPEVKGLTQRGTRAADQSDGEAHFGGVGPIDDENGGFSVGLGVHTAERFNAEAWYSVDGAGRLTVTVLGSDVAVPPDGIRTVQRACAR